MRRDLRKYTKRNLRSSKSVSFFQNLSTSNKLIAINIACFILFLILLSTLGEVETLSITALQPNAIFQTGNVWTLLTSIFIHAGMLHLFVNMFSLFFIGNFLEKLIGSKRFLWFYLLSGIFAGIFFILLSYFFGTTELGAKIFGSPSIYGVGASGALFAIVGVLAILVPKARIYLILGPLIIIIAQFTFGTFLPESFYSIFSLLTNILIFLMIFALFSFNPKFRKIAVPVEMPMWVLPIIAIVPLIIISAFVEMPIGNMAHLGGLLAGLAYGTYLKKKFPRKTAEISRRFSR